MQGLYNKYIIQKINSYNNHYDLEDNFPSFINDKIDISKNKVKDLKKLKKDILSEKKTHEDDCENKDDCDQSKKYNKSLEIIDSRISKYSYKFLKLLSKFWWLFIIPILVGLILFIITT